MLFHDELGRKKLFVTAIIEKNSSIRNSVSAEYKAIPVFLFFIFICINGFIVIQRILLYLTMQS